MKQKIDWERRVKTLKEKLQEDGVNVNVINMRIIGEWIIVLNDKAIASKPNLKRIGDTLQGMLYMNKFNKKPWEGWKQEV